MRDRVPGVASVSVTRRVGARPATAVASDPLAERADRIQYEVGKGPCLHALTAGEPVRLDLTATDDRRWPGFRSRMRAETAIRSVLSHPLPDVVPASLNVYLATPPPGDDAVAAAAVAAGLVLAAAAARDRADQLREALDSSRTIGAAIGILMVRDGVTRDAAFAALREASQLRNRKLRDLAAEIVASRTG
ncbi:ANTAR domain protein [Pseudonocardia dioxanivorans CB1190]|uniref:ANTAR domain protein n=1 Tax=Pseudonocardia dioxanivorans (strain ATCC 55486 / DSM 44775 / JCM 13855 / CB1190) TaxID=675635 RepID=F4CUC3_PSEUX|nr:ANTAR domain-containing protein [Pseudonocardia dioxanivorans]AEA24582.1 ANTAR domain protein [Pseudonocardia dioxanivorans CB1190]